MRAVPGVLGAGGFRSFTVRIPVLCPKPHKGGIEVSFPDLAGKRKILVNEKVVDSMFGLPKKKDFEINGPTTNCLLVISSIRCRELPLR